MSDTTPTPTPDETPAGINHMQPPPGYVSHRPPRPVPQKDVGIAYLFWFFLGAFGGHKFYLGRTWWGVLYLFTLGIVGIGVLVDLFALPGQVRRRNEELYQAAVR